MFLCLLCNCGVTEYPNWSKNQFYTSAHFDWFFNCNIISQSWVLCTCKLWLSVAWQSIVLFNNSLSQDLLIAAMQYAMIIQCHDYMCSKERTYYDINQFSLWVRAKLKSSIICLWVIICWVVVRRRGLSSMSLCFGMCFLFGLYHDNLLLDSKEGSTLWWWSWSR